MIESTLGWVHEP